MRNIAASSISAWWRRNEHNAIIQHGTMTIVPKIALEEVDGWSEWCITEDTELGLKLFEAGYEAAYMRQTHGLGPRARHLEAFMSQRYRWVYGAMQMLKRHAGAIFFGGSALSLGTALSVPVRLAALDFRRTRHGGDHHGDGMDAADVGSSDICGRAHAGLSAAAMALFATKLIKTLLLSAQGGIGRTRRHRRLHRGPLADPHRGQGGVDGLADLGQALPAHPQMLRPGGSARCCGWCGRRRRC